MKRAIGTESTPMRAICWRRRRPQTSTWRVAAAVRPARMPHSPIPMARSMPPLPRATNGARSRSDMAGDATCLVGGEAVLEDKGNLLASDPAHGRHYAGDGDAGDVIPGTEDSHL